ncbi:hypothetical protein [Pseudomonas sp. CCNWLW23]|uniref:hypothetical protein n=1 Tax=Pseudomonas sp. CCNWLW23 TaxID=3126385 RepID=UPI003012F968
MQNFLIIILLAGLLGVTAISGYLYLLLRSPDKPEEIKPLNTFVLGVVVVLFVVTVVATYFYSVSDEFSISNNLGQVGDFIGGLTNPLLSFLALLVLLRTTLIQTDEARKTTSFMGKQHDILEREKFEGTFFQLLDRLESYCERHLRVNKPGSNKTVASVLSSSIYSKRANFDKLPAKAQLKAVKAHIKLVAQGDMCYGFYARAARVIRFINNSNLPITWRKSYAALLKDSMYPSERVMFVNYAFSNKKTWRGLIKAWGVSGIVSRCYASKIVEDYYGK